MTTIAQIMNEAAQQNWHPQLVVTNSEYDPKFFKLLSDPANGVGILTDQPFAMFLGEDAANNPEVQLFDDVDEEDPPEPGPRPLRHVLLGSRPSSSWTR